jgi:hypothetical protein
MRRIMYVECKARGLDGEGRIGWVTLSKSRRSYWYQGRELAKTKSGYKYNCVDMQTGEPWWVSGPRRDGADKLYGGVVQIDDDARVEYWTAIRRMPSRVADSEYAAGPSTRTAGRLLKDRRKRKVAGRG